MDSDLRIYEGDVSSSRHSRALFAVTQTISSKLTGVQLDFKQNKLIAYQVPYHPQVSSHSYLGKDIVYWETGSV